MYFFAAIMCKHDLASTARNRLYDVTFFFGLAFTENKITRLDDTFVLAFSAKKNYKKVAPLYRIEKHYTQFFRTKKLHACSQCPTSDLVPRFEALETPAHGRGYVATRPTCGPLLILSRNLKRWGPPIRQGLCPHQAHLWADADFAPRSKALGTPSDGMGYVRVLAHRAPFF